MIPTASSSRASKHYYLCISLILLLGTSLASSDDVSVIRLVLANVRKWQKQQQQQQQQQQAAPLPANTNEQRQRQRQRQRRPFVTLAYAQSLDGKLAPYIQAPKELILSSDGQGHWKEGCGQRLGDGSAQQRINQTTTASNFGLSGPSSWLLTHALRSVHQGILVGGKTLVTDNPRLNNRLWNTNNTSSNSSATTTTNSSGHQRQRQQQHFQPRPVILDTHLTRARHWSDAERQCRARNAIVCCSYEAAKSCNYSVPEWPDAQVLPCRCAAAHGAPYVLDLQDVLTQLYETCGIATLMVEGGPTVLSSFMELDCVDCVCVTIAPMYLGPGASIQLFSNRPGALTKVQYMQLGEDCCLLARWNHTKS